VTHHLPSPSARAVVARCAYSLIAATLLLLPAPAMLHTVARATPLAVYGDALTAGWTNCSWDSGIDFAATDEVYGGGQAIRLTVSAPRGGLCLQAGQVLDAAAYSDLRFAAKAGQNGQRFQAFLYDASMQPLGYVWLANAGGDPVTDAWKLYTVPLAHLGAAGRQIKGVGIQEIDAGAGQPFYLDEISLVGTVPTPTAAPTPVSPSPSPTVAPTPVWPSPSLLAYGDALSAGWSNCSWNSAVDFAGTQQVYSGARAISITPTDARGGLCLFAPQPIDTTPYTRLHFAARTAQSGQHYQLFLYDADGRPVGAYLWLSSFTGDPNPGAWNVYDIPLGMLGGVSRSIRGLAIQQIDSSAGQALYIDEVALTGSPAPSSAPTPAPAPATPITLGAYVNGAPWDPAPLDTFTSLVGAAPAIVMWYEGWGLTSRGEFDPNRPELVTARGAVPMVTWMPWEHEGGPDQPAFALRTIIAGSHDAYIRRWAQAASGWGKPLYLRFAHEMNGNWYPWSAGVNGNTSAEYAGAWRHVHDIFVEERATNVRWVWSPNVLDQGSGPFAEMYPGDAYVDWVALGGYNRGPTHVYNTWRSVVEVFGYSYELLTALTNKPVMIAETASTEVGGSKSDWITMGFLAEIPTRLPKVRAAVWFHEDKETDWRVNSSPASLVAFRQVVRSPTYQGRLS